MITITVSNGVGAFDFSRYFKDYHFGVGSGNPVFSGGSSGSDGSRISLNYDDGKSVVLDGENFQYTLSNHFLSGRVESATYTEAGRSQVTITGLDLFTEPGKDGEVGDFVFSLMGDDPSGTGEADASPALLLRTISAEAQHFVGGTAADSYRGTRFDDTIEGNLGRDTLTGGAGDDTFVFDTRLAATNVDKITDFRVADDGFEIDNAVFRGLKAGGLAATAFFEGTAAHDANDRVIYNDKTGALLFDADGSGAGRAVQFAAVSKNLALDHHDFFVI